MLITYIHHVRVPLLLLHGDNDITVPRGETVQVAALLQKDGKTVAAHYYPNEGHGFTNAKIRSTRSNARWTGSTAT